MGYGIGGYAATVFALHLGKMRTLVTNNVNTVNRVKGYGW